jgi:hypothetical protein
MSLNQTLKYLIGFATAFVSLFPFLMLPVLGLLFMLDLLFLLNPSEFAAHSDIILGFLVSGLLAVFLATAYFKIVQFGLKIFYIVHEIENRSLANVYRIIFVIGTVWIPYVVMPIYYFAHIGRARHELTTELVNREPNTH